jgi:flagellar hook protein FlgE
MSFNTAISGLNAAQSELEVIANNIANVNTTGFKKSRAEFGDIYSVGSLGNSGTAIGSGVILQSVSQQFNQGNMNFTSNTLDFGVSGEGFFVLAPNALSTERVFTRAGAFGVNSDGFVVNASGQLLQAFPVNADGTVSSTALSSTTPLRLPDSAGTPQQTSLIDLGVNLPANVPGLDPTLFNPAQSNTYTASTSVNIYDSLGDSHIASLYFVKDGTPGVTNQWKLFTVVDNQRVNLDDGAGGTVPSATIEFDSSGKYQGTTPATIKTVKLGTDAANTGFINGPDPDQQFQVTLNNSLPTQFASPFTVNSLSQDGFAIGRLTGLDVSDTGVVRATYTNGQTSAVGKLALARFPSTGGLSQIGNTSWAQTTESGEALAGEAGTSSFGLIKSGSLELSNVDLTEELVGLITAQRNFQANAKSIETSNAITQAIINIR